MNPNSCEENRIISSAQRLRCTASNRKRSNKLQDEIAIAGGVDAVGGWRIEAQLVGHRAAVERQGRAGHRARAQGTKIQPLAAVGQAVCVAQKHFHVGQQPVRDQHRLGPLQMGVGGHGGASRLFSPVERNAQPVRQIGAHLVDRGPHVKTQVGRDLLIAAASAVQLVAGVADQHDQLLLDKVMHVFGFAVVQKRRRRCRLLANLLQP